MVNLFEQFMKQEFVWIYEDGDCVESLLEGFDGEITEDEFYDNFDEFLDKAVKQYCNNEYIIQIMHENMHDELIDVLKKHLNERE